MNNIIINTNSNTHTIVFYLRFPLDFSMNPFPSMRQWAYY